LRSDTPFTQFQPKKAKAETAFHEKIAQPQAALCSTPEHHEKVADDLLDHLCTTAGALNTLDADDMQPDST
jgi:hypothetical protein